MTWLLRLKSLKLRIKTPYNQVRIVRIVQDVGIVGYMKSSSSERGSMEEKKDPERETTPIEPSPPPIDPYNAYNQYSTSLATDIQMPSEPSPHSGSEEEGNPSVRLNEYEKLPQRITKKVQSSCKCRKYWRFLS